MLCMQMIFKRQIGVGPLVNRQERRAAMVPLDKPLVNRF